MGSSTKKAHPRIAPHTGAEASPTVLQVALLPASTVCTAQLGLRHSRGHVFVELPI